MSLLRPSRMKRSREEDAPGDLPVVQQSLTELLETMSLTPRSSKKPRIEMTTTQPTFSSEIVDKENEDMCDGNEQMKKLNLKELDVANKAKRVDQNKLVENLGKESNDFSNQECNGSPQVNENEGSTGRNHDAGNVVGSHYEQRTSANYKRHGRIVQEDLNGIGKPMISCDGVHIDHVDDGNPNEHKPNKRKNIEDEDTGKQREDHVKLNDNSEGTTNDDGPGKLNAANKTAPDIVGNIGHNGDDLNQQRNEGSDRNDGDVNDDGEKGQDAAVTENGNIHEVYDILGYHKNVGEEAMLLVKWKKEDKEKWWIYESDFTFPEYLKEAIENLKRIRALKKKKMYKRHTPMSLSCSLARKGYPPKNEKQPNK